MCIEYIQVKKQDTLTPWEYDADGWHRKQPVVENLGPQWIPVVQQNHPKKNCIYKYIKEYIFKERIEENLIKTL